MCGHALCLQGYAHPVHRSERKRDIYEERERERERYEERERERERESEGGRESFLNE